MKNYASNIGIILPVAINDVIYLMKGIYKTTTEGKKPCGRPSDKKIKMVMMDF